jgi:hypothetical protein
VGEARGVFEGLVRGLEGKEEDKGEGESKGKRKEKGKKGATGRDMLGPMCRAKGSLGQVEYLLAEAAWKEGGDKREVREGLDRAVRSLQEGAKIAGRIQRVENCKGSSHTTTTRHREARVWEAMAEGRLALCYMLQADMESEAAESERLLEKAAVAAEGAVNQMRYEHDGRSALPTLLFFYGRVLLRQGKEELALEQFNYDSTDWQWAPVVTPPMAMCKEPSPEHRGYLREMVAAGAALDTRDDADYTALDHAVFSGDAETEAIVVDGLRTQLNLSETDLEALRTEARLRKGYREVLQERLRPVLFARGEDRSYIKKLRRVYAETLADAEKGSQFDHLKYIRYTDFKQFGRLARSTDGLVRPYTGEDESPLDFLIFFSYRWINQDRSLNTPDDANGTQYQRMLHATDLFLQQNPGIDVEKLGIWMVCSTPRQPIPSANTGPGLCMRRPGQPRDGRLVAAHHDPPVRRRHQPGRQHILRPGLVLRRGHDDQRARPLLFAAVRRSVV